MFEYRVGRFIFKYSAELTVEQVCYEGSDYQSVFEAYPNYVETENISGSNHTEVEAFTACKKYIFNNIDDSGLVALLNWKFEFRSLGLVKESNLTLAMIYSYETWMSKCWAAYDNFKQQIQNNETIILDYSSVGEPACKFKDIQYTFDTSLQALEPRVFNTDINYYLTWT